MAYVERRKNGWMAQIRRRGMPTLARTFDLKADAEDWAREIERELRRGNIAALRQEAQRVTIAEVADRYAECVLPMKRAKSARTELAAVRERFGALFLASISPPDVAQWRDELLRQGYASQSVRHRINALSVLFGYAERELGIALPAGNPCRGVRKPPPSQARDRRLRPGEYDALLGAARRSRSRVGGVEQIIVLAVETSMRLGELLALEWRNIDLRARTAHLPRTKNGESRTVALSTAAVCALQALPRRLDGRVFGWARADSFEHTWRRCVERARADYEAQCAAQGTGPDPAFLDDLRFHDLRHEATTRLFEHGLGVMEVASMTGHKSLAMLKRYTHVDAERLAKKLA